MEFNVSRLHHRWNTTLQWLMVTTLFFQKIGFAQAVRGNSSETNHLLNITVETQESSRIIHIACEHTPVYTIFRLKDPMRLVIDIANGDTSKIQGPIEVNDGILSEISKAQFTNRKTTLGQVIVGFARIVDYEVKDHANEVVVTVAASAANTPAPPQPASTVTPVETKSENKESLREKLPASLVTKPVLEPTSKPASIVPERPKTLRKISPHVTKESADIDVSINGGTPLYEVTELENPPRVVIDLMAVHAHVQHPDVWKLGAIGKLRVGIHADKTRLVIEATNTLPHYRLLQTPGGLRIEARMANISENQTTEKPTPALTVVKSPSPSSAEISHRSENPSSEPTTSVPKPRSKLSDLPQAPSPKIRPERMLMPPETASLNHDIEPHQNSVSSGNAKRISLDLRGADLLNVLRLISEVSGENVIAGDDVNGKVTLRLHNVPWDLALDEVLRTKGFGRLRSGNIIRVAPIEKLQKEKEAELARLKADEQVAPLYVRLIPINYARAAAILEQLKPLATKDRGKINVDERTNTIIVEDLLEVLNKMESLAKRLDTQTPQVLIEARIVEANSSFLRDVGIQWGGAGIASAGTGNPTGLAFPSVVGAAGGADGTSPNANGTVTPPRYAVNLPAPVQAGAGGAIGFIFGNASNTAQLTLRLSALENNGTVRIISAPKIATLDNSKARIAQGVSIPISVVSAAGVSTRFVEANLELEVTPHVTQDGSVLMDIKAAKNEPDFSRTGAQGDPTIQKKTAETNVMVKDGDTTVIGGIYTRNQSVTYNEVPYLGKIPVLGWLFRHKNEQDTRAELLVFITPRIINRAQAVVTPGSNL